MLWKRNALRKVAGRKFPTAYRIAAVRRHGDTARPNGGNLIVTQLRDPGLGADHRSGVGVSRPGAPAAGVEATRRTYAKDP